MVYAWTVDSVDAVCAFLSSLYVIQELNSVLLLLPS
jgi:hypothetical protein